MIGGHRTLNIVLSCTDRKRADASQVVRLRDIDEHDLAKRAARWAWAVRESPYRVRASTLYCGDHWSVGASIAGVAVKRGWMPNVWVASAGLGLINADDDVPPYSATFSLGKADSVRRKHDRSDVNAAWWSELAAGRRRRQTLVDVVGAEGATTLVVASPAYVAALSNDLTNAIERHGVDRLLIFSSGLALKGSELNRCWVPVVADLRMSLGGALTSVNARAARCVVEKTAIDAFTRDAAESVLKAELEASPVLPTHSRVRSDDDSLTNFILESLRADARATTGKLLRQLRDQGRACEQKRFRDLFRQVTAK